ncbi:MAG: PPK2 family polyphosphate kinase [Myxococcota bacterium]
MAGGATRTRWQVPFDETFDLRQAPTQPDDTPDPHRLAKALAEQVDALRKLQRAFYADGRTALLLIFQGMDASGKDSTIRRVLTGVNPAGCRVVSFGPPSPEELRHDFLWRCVRELPAKGQIGIFNRSWYEDVTIVRVHPEGLDLREDTWTSRLRSIREFERHLADNGTVVLKFFLHLSREEQARRLLSRIDRPSKNWKFDNSDIAERAHWDDYQAAYQAALAATSRPEAPWYVVPADDKPFARLQVAQTVVEVLRHLKPRFPTVDEARRAELDGFRDHLLAELPEGELKGS